MNRALSLAVIALIALVAPAAALAAPTWAVDHAASKLGFGGRVSGAGFNGVFRRGDAVIHFDPKDLAHSDVAVTMDMASATTGNGDRDALLPDQDWFWTSRFPRATFVARNFTPTGP